MPDDPTFPLPLLSSGAEIGTMDEKTGKRQVNYYVEKENDLDIRKEVYDRKLSDVTYSASKLTNEALKVYFLVRRLQKEFKNFEDPYDMVREAISLHLTGAQKKRK